MKRRTIGFTYTREVTSPASQVGAAGEHRQLDPAEAEHLESLGYGWRDGHEPKPQEDETEEETNGIERVEAYVEPEIETGD